MKKLLKNLLKRAARRSAPTVIAALAVIHFSLLAFPAAAEEADRVFDLEQRDEMRHLIMNLSGTADPAAKAWEDYQSGCEQAVAGAFTDMVGRQSASPSPDQTAKARVDRLVRPESERPSVMVSGAVGAWRLAWGRVGRPVTRIRADYSLGDRLLAPSWLKEKEIDWARTYQESSKLPGQANIFFFAGSGDLTDAAIYFAGGGVSVIVTWCLKDSDETSTDVYRVANSSSDRPYRLYRTDEPYGNNPVQLASSYVKLAGSDNLLSCTYDVTVTTNIVQVGPFWTTNVVTSTNGITRGVYVSGGRLYSVGDVKGQFLLAYYDSADYTRVLDVQVVEACTPSVKIVSAEVGDQLHPVADGYGADGLYPEVVSSKRTTYDARGDFIYVHSGAASYEPHRNAAFAIRPTYDEDDRLDHTWDATINWYAPDELGTQWPFEQTQYSIRWGEGQRMLVSGDADAPGQNPIFPSDWSVEACKYQQPDGHLVSVDGADSSAGLVWLGAGKSLLKITGKTSAGLNDIAFVRIDSVLAETVTAPTTEQTIGTRVIPAYEGAAAVTNDSGVTWLGYIHEPWSALCFDDDDYVAPSRALVEGSSDDATADALDGLDLAVDEDDATGAIDDVSDALDEIDSDTANRSDIFFVNCPEPKLPVPETVEVWWNAACSAGDLAGTAYAPAFREKFKPVFPDEYGTEQIVLASQKGSAGVSVWTTQGTGGVRGQGTSVWHTNATIRVLSGTFPKVYAGGTNAVDGTGRAWSPNATHAWCAETTDGIVCWALRCDMKVHSTLTHPFVYVKGIGPDGNRRVWVYYVLATNAAYPSFAGDMEVGCVLPGPHPLDTREEPWVDEIWWKSTTDLSKIVAYRDRKGKVWARRDGTLSIHMYYPNEESFAYTYFLNGAPRAWEVPVPVRTSVPWNCTLVPNEPVNTAEPGVWRWTATWPENIPTMKVAQTLTKAKNLVPEVWGASSAAVLWPEPDDVGIALYAKENSTAQLVDPSCARKASLAFDSSFTVGTALGNLGFSADPGGNCVYRNGVYYFRDLPGSLSKRLYFDPNATILNCLILVGELDTSSSLTEILYPNVLTDAERTAVKALVPETNAYKAKWDAAIDAFATEAILPNGHRYERHQSPSGEWYWEFATTYSPIDHYALATLGGGDSGQTNYVVWIENDADPETSGLDVDEGDAVSMHVFGVEPAYYAGDCVTRTDENNLLSQLLDVVYTDPLGGKADDFYFEWQCAEPNADGTEPSADKFHTCGRSGVGLTRFTLGTDGSMADILKNTYWRVHYRARSGTAAAARMGENVWSAYTAPCLAESWLQRVINSVTPFTQRVTDLYDNPPETTVSMLSQIGGPYVGDVALNMDNLTEVGLLETYMTLLNKAESMSIAMGTSASIDDTSVNKQLMQLVERMDDFYALLGNEAYSDAANPTIACSDSTSASTSSLCLSGLFCFDNQVATLLDEELALLRGRDVLQEESAGTDLATYREKPCYNRLLWNFTRGLTEGEVAYAMNYDIYADGTSTDIDASDAAAAYPQGHGDAWGHYLSALKLWYRLLRNPSFTWIVSMGEMNVDDHPINVDYYEEQKMAEAAAALGKAAQRVVDLTARKVWRDRGGTLSAAEAGYEDERSDRAFGYGEWASRGGIACFANWVVANSLLPAADATETAYTDEGLLNINRSTVTALADLANRYDAIQRTDDRLNANLNPLGLADNTVPFGISPAAADGSESHFEQSLESAETALKNATALLDKAGEATARLRELSYAAREAADDATSEEADYDQRLIAYYGYPYDGDIGVGKTYEQGYDGPDLYHWMYVDREFSVSDDEEDQTVVVRVDRTLSSPLGSLKVVSYDYSDSGFVVKPVRVTGSRRAWGKLQYAYIDYLKAVRAFEAATDSYKTTVEDTRSLLKAMVKRLVTSALSVKSSAAAAESSSDATEAWQKFDAAVDILQSETLLKSNVRVSQLGGSVYTSEYELETTGKNPGVTTGTSTSEPDEDTKLLMETALEEDESSLETEISKLNQQRIQASTAQAKASIAEKIATTLSGAAGLAADVSDVAAQAAERFAKCNEKAEAVVQAALAIVEPLETIQTLVAEAEAIQGERETARIRRAQKAARLRYSDMAHRLWRDEALDTYADAFDLAQKYTYLAAKAYDYETGGAITAGGERAEFLDEIIGTRLPGETQSDGSPLRWGGSGDAGLSDILARLKENYTVLKPRLGINNPQDEITWFSLRSEAFRILPGADGLNAWRNKLDTYRVSSLKNVSAYTRLCSGSDDEPAIVIPLSTVIEKGKNFFGLDLAGGESKFSETYFATKIAEAGVELVGYNEGLTGGTVSVFSATPYVYLVPAGFDRMRAPATGETISFDVADQVLPVPNILGDKAIDADWNELYVNLTGQTAGNVNVRKFPAFRANGESNASTLIGRSVWNTEWVLIIPGSSLRADGDAALKDFIWGNANTPGVTDIKIGFRTYSHWGQ